jgi:hypothetical protein
MAPVASRRIPRGPVLTAHSIVRPQPPINPVFLAQQIQRLAALGCPVPIPSPSGYPDDRALDRPSSQSMSTTKVTFPTSAKPIAEVSNVVSLVLGSFNA